MNDRTFVVRVAAYERVSEGRREFRALLQACDVAPSFVHDAVLIERARRGGSVVKAMGGSLLTPALFDNMTIEPTPVAGLSWPGISPAGRRRLAAVCRTGDAWLIVVAAAPIWRLTGTPSSTPLDAFEEVLPLAAVHRFDPRTDSGPSSPPTGRDRSSAWSAQAGPRERHDRC